MLVIMFFHTKDAGQAVHQGHNHPHGHILATKLHNSCTSVTEHRIVLHKHDGYKHTNIGTSCASMTDIHIFIQM